MSTSIYVKVQEWISGLCTCTQFIMTKIYKQNHAQKESLFFQLTYFTTVHLQIFPNTSNLRPKCESHRGTAIHLGPVALSRNTAETYTPLFKLLLEKFALPASLYKCNFATANFDANTLCAFYFAKFYYYGPLHACPLEKLMYDLHQKLVKLWRICLFNGHLLSPISFLSLLLF